VVNLHALPYTDDRQQLYSELSRASVALMPSWHEGFGLVAWEAIAAGVPLIVRSIAVCIVCWMRNTTVRGPGLYTR
jgi:glycosyltransferase involved in cell wall biosynthesis